MKRLEALVYDVFNVLPIITCSITHYYICVLSDNNRMEELCYLRIIINSLFCFL